MNCLLFLSPPFLAQEAQATPSPGATQETVLKLLQAGGWVMIPLVLASVLTLALILACIISLRRSSVVTHRFMETAEALLRKRDYLGLIAVSNRHSSAIARITSRTLDFATKHPSAPPSAIRDVAETEGGRVASSLNQRIIFLPCWVCWGRWSASSTHLAFWPATPLSHDKCYWLGASPKRL
jgi:biopolymer transport protein ExbB